MGRHYEILLYFPVSVTGVLELLRGLSMRAQVSLCISRAEILSALT